MTDDDIIKLDDKYQSHPDSKVPNLRGRDDILAFAREVLSADRPLYLPLNVPVIADLERMRECVKKGWNWFY